MARHEVATTDDLDGDGSRIITEIEGQEIAVFRLRGEYHAIANYCVHQGGPLCEGELRKELDVGDDGWIWEYTSEEKFITCPWHGWRFDVQSGENNIDPRYRVPTYDVEVEDGRLYVLD